VPRSTSSQLSTPLMNCLSTERNTRSADWMLV
jgi:hypothetical protein